ncbi:MAG: pentapeptide repeat-containing protein [Rhodospirillaceae bacterium]|nr:MAG: pentapeptide repeat-containing protein [Rhodospirillaceae bacterium]
MGNIKAVRALKGGKDEWHKYCEQPEASYDFSGENFDRLNLSELIFKEAANFRSCKFGSLTLRSVKFYGDVDFSEIQVSGNTFMSCTSDRMLNFNDARFDGRVVVAAELRNCSFERAIFNAAVSVFRQRVFFVTFKACQFLDYVDFTNAQLEDVVFEAVTFSDQAGIPNPRFVSSEFQGLSFHKAQFCGQANFENAKFTASANFTKCRFDKAPKFHQVDMHEGVTFSDTSEFDQQFPDTYSSDAAHCYQTLKKKMVSLDATAAAVSFARLELKSRHRQVTRSRWLFMLYWAMSDYGLSTWRPLCWLFGVTIAGVFVAWLCAVCGTPPLDKELWSLAIASSFPLSVTAKITLPQGAIDIIRPEFRFWYSLWVGFQSVSSATLLFLCGLAIRNHLRLK